MFTGIVHSCVPIEKIEKEMQGALITLKFTDELFQGLTRGASVAVDGVCLTVAAIKDLSISFDVMEETLKKTTLGVLGEGRCVNTERALVVGDEIGGHMLSGHVTGTAEIISVRKDGDYILTLRSPADTLKYLFPKGYVALDGVSLTLVDVKQKENTFTVHLIPETLRVTGLQYKKTGDFVNVEIDPQTRATVDTVERILESTRT